MTPKTAIKTLLAHGFNQAAIAKAVVTSTSNIGRILHSDHEPSYTVGKNLVDLALHHALQGSKK